MRWPRRRRGRTEVAAPGDRPQSRADPDELTVVRVDRTRDQLAWMFADKVTRRLDVRAETVPDANPERFWFSVSSDAGAVYCSHWNDGFGDSVETFRELHEKAFPWWQPQPQPRPGRDPRGPQHSPDGNLVR
jgi:hypothetical protein